MAVETFAHTSLLQMLRTRRPVVHCIAGAVTAAFIADVLGALGARPALTHDPAEAGALAARADALLVNLGQPDPLRIEGCRTAARTAHMAGTPWVLDPVLSHTSERRRVLTHELLRWRPAILKPNRAELTALTENARGGPAELARHLASTTGAVVLVSGETDIIGDDKHSEEIGGGHVFMDTLPGFGCALGAAAAVLLSVAPDAFSAAYVAAATFAEAGSRATEKMHGPGSFRIAFLDELHRLGEAS